MTKFIELHIFTNGTKVYININEISHIIEVLGRLHIYMRSTELSSNQSGGSISSINGKQKYIVVRESYSKVKSLIED